MKCPYCNSSLTDLSAKFCEKCGRQLIAPPTKKKSPVVLLCVIILLLVIAVVIMAVLLAGQSSSQEQLTTDSQSVQQTQDIPDQTDGTQEQTDAPENTAAPENTTAPYKENFTIAGVSSDYLYPTDEKLLTFEVLSAYSEYEVDLICNEMYARHGYIFSKQSNRSYFEAQSWYVGKYTDMAYVVGLFNYYEQRNLGIISDYRDYMGW